MVLGINDFIHLLEWVMKYELSAVVNLKCLGSVNVLAQLNDETSG